MTIAQGDEKVKLKRSQPTRVRENQRSERKGRKDFKSQNIRKFAVMVSPRSSCLNKSGHVNVERGHFQRSTSPDKELQTTNGCCVKDS